MGWDAGRCDCPGNVCHCLLVSGWQEMCHECRNWDCFRIPLGFGYVPMEMTTHLMPRVCV